MPFYHAGLPVNGNPGEVSHVLVGSRQLVKERGLAAVLVSHQSIGQYSSIRQRIFTFLIVVLTCLTKSRMLRGIDMFYSFVLVGAGGYEFNFDLSCILKSQCQFIAVYLKLHGISEGREFDNCHLCSRNDSHIQKMLSQSPFSSDGPDDSTLSDFQFS